jgi:long-subunit fatty acid transport protein
MSFRRAETAYPFSGTLRGLAFGGLLFCALSSATADETSTPGYLQADMLWKGFGLSTPLDRSELREPLFTQYDILGHADSALNLQPGLSLRLGEHWSLGAGLSLSQREEGAGLSYSQSDGLRPDYETHDQSRLGWDTGFRLGMNLSLNEQTSLGWQYRTSPTTRTESLFATVGVDDNAPTYREPADPVSPAIALFGFRHQAAARWTLLGQYSWVTSGVPEGAYASLDEGNDINAKGDKNHWSLAFGSEYRYDPQWVLRGGLQYSQIPSLEQYNDSTRLELGAAYRGNDRLSVEMAYTHVMLKQQSLALDRDYQGTELGEMMSLPGRGNSHVFGLGLRLAF